MTKPLRLDAELVRRGLSPSRAAARRAIEAGSVTVGGIPARRAAALVLPSQPIAVAEAGPPFVSRGGQKLDGALRDLEVEVSGRSWLDAGASTGGFTDRLLQGGASRVVAIDVGYGQLDWRLRNDPRVVVMEKVNVRHLRPADLPFRPDGVVADLSFISLTAALPALATAAPGADFVLLVKPQFEVGRESVGRGGVVRSPELWLRSLERVTAGASELGLGLSGVTLADPPGPAGNREFFVHVRSGGALGSEALEQTVEEASRR